MKKYIVILILIVFVGVFKSNAQDDKFKALMIYNFTRVIGWPADYSQGNFVMEVVGSSDVLKELKNISQTKKVGAQTIEVKSISSPTEIGKCQIIYIPAGSENLLGDVLNATKGTATLVITDKKGLNNAGSCINFFAEGGQLKYEVLLGNMKSKGLIPSTSLTEPENAIKIQ